MGTKHISNDGPNAIYVGGKMIAPGEGRDIDERDLPPELRDAPVVVAEPAPSLDDDLQALRGESVHAIEAQLAGMTLEALERLGELEGEAKRPRKSLLEAISDERLRRANERLQSDDLDADTVTGGAGADGADEADE